LGNINTVYTSLVDASSTACADLGLPPLASGWTYSCVVNSANLQKIDGTGWIPINLSNVGLIPSLPIDPTNSSASNLYYSYIVNSSGQFELTSTLESQKKLKDTALKDGGTDPAKYETGETVALWTQASGLVGYWPFDEGSGAATADLSGNNNTGSLVNGPTWLTNSSCKVSNCLNFGVSGSEVTVPNSVNLPSSFTFSQWIYTSNASGQVYTIGNAGGGNGYRFGISTGKIGFLIGDTTYTESICGSNTVNDNKWHLITGVFNRVSPYSFSCYIDGIFQSSISLPSGYLSMSNAAPAFASPPCCVHFTGYMDDIRIYSRALSATEIQNMYNATK
jgi:hypothetical protein